MDEIVTHEVPLRDYQKALDLALAREGIKLLSSHDVAKHMNHHWMRVECHYSNFTFMRRDPNLLTPKYEKLDK